MAEDERSRLARTYRDLEGKELLALYGKRDDLSPMAAEVLRDELKLRGLDPDSLKPTVPKATDGPAEEGPVEEEALPDRPPEVPEELKGEFDPSGEMLLCPSCGAPNHPTEERCRSCGAELPRKGEEEGQEEAPTAAAQPLVPEETGAPGTLASATFSLIGVAGLFFAAYAGMATRDAGLTLPAVAGLVGVAALATGVLLWRRAKKGVGGPAAP